MKVFALSILGLALAVPAARAQNRDTSMNDTSKTTAQPSTDTSARRLTTTSVSAGVIDT